MVAKYVVLMYYGFPSDPEGLMEYLRDIFRGKEPPGFVVEDNRRKIALLGGTSPSTRIVSSIRDKVEQSLKKIMPEYEVVLLAKHVKPSINEAAQILGKPDVSVEVPLFPIYSSFVFSSYFDPFEKNVDSTRTVRVSDLASSKEFQQHFTKEIEKNYDTDERSSLFIFTSHSVPIHGYEPYPKNILEVAGAICRDTGIGRPFLVYHSRGPFGNNWLGPDFNYLLDYCHRKQVRKVVAIPIGFLYDHIEVLYDLDIDLKGRLEHEGISFERVPLPNDSQSTVSTIVTSISRNLGGKQ